MDLWTCGNYEVLGVGDRGQTEKAGKEGGWRGVGSGVGDITTNKEWIRFSFVCDFIAGMGG